VKAFCFNNRVVQAKLEAAARKIIFRGGEHSLRCGQWAFPRGRGGTLRCGRRGGPYSPKIQIGKIKGHANFLFFFFFSCFARRGM
jgi:hypothetical protein